MIKYVDLKNIDVIAPNFKYRLSGVTSTIIQLIPAQNILGTRIAVLGPGLPGTLAHIRFSHLWKLWQKPAHAKYRIWHARRNFEMLPGIIMRDLMGMKIKLIFTSAAQRDHRAYTKWLISKMDKLVTPCEKAAAYLDGESSTIYHGVDLKRFVPHEDKAALKSELKLDGNKKIVGCFGRIRPQKGTDLFVDTMIALLPKHPQWMAIIGGRTTSAHQSFQQKLEKKIAQAKLSDRILFIGEYKDTKSWYQALDLYIAPQRWEGFGLIPMEVGACGVPTIATNVGAFSELVIDGETGSVIEIENLEQMIVRCDQYLSDENLIKKAGQKSRKHMEQNFSLEREATSLNQIYKTVAEYE